MIPGLLLFVLFGSTSGRKIDNSIDLSEEGSGPRIFCFRNGMRFQVHTRNPFTGRLYVKGKNTTMQGMYNNPECQKNFTGTTSDPFLNVAYEDCIHTRERMRRPPGMMISLELVAQFHPFFTTSVDRAFIVSCSYRESVNTVTNNQLLQGNVANVKGTAIIPVQRVTYQPEMPHCLYTIHKGSPNGPLISFAKVGETTFHKWECLPSEDGEFHGLLVHSCFAKSGGLAIRLLDRKGCSLDPFAMATPSYSTNLSAAFVEVHAFKFADSLQISFSCSISLCLRMNDRCKGITPPNCTDTEANVVLPPATGLGQPGGGNVNRPAAVFREESQPSGYGGEDGPLRPPPLPWDRNMELDIAGDVDSVRRRWIGAPSASPDSRRLRPVRLPLNSPALYYPPSHIFHANDHAKPTTVRERFTADSRTLGLQESKEEKSDETTTMAYRDYADYRDDVKSDYPTIQLSSGYQHGDDPILSQLPSEELEFLQRLQKVDAAAVGVPAPRFFLDEDKHLRVAVREEEIMGQDIQLDNEGFLVLESETEFPSHALEGGNWTRDGEVVSYRERVPSEELCLNRWLAIQAGLMLAFVFALALTAILALSCRLARRTTPPEAWTFLETAKTAMKTNPELAGPYSFGGRRRGR